MQLSGTPALGSKAFSFDLASQVTGFNYDLLGRRLSDGMRTYVWNDASWLTSYTEGGNTVSLGYDGLGHRTSRTEGGVTRDFVWNYGYQKTSVSIERQGGFDLRYYVHLPDGRLLYSVDAMTDERRYYHGDETGNVTMTTDDAGAVVNAYYYGAFGRVLAAIATAEIGLIPVISFFFCSSCSSFLLLSSHLMTSSDFSISRTISLVS